MSWEPGMRNAEWEQKMASDEVRRGRRNDPGLGLGSGLGSIARIASVPEQVLRWVRGASRLRNATGLVRQWRGELDAPPFGASSPLTDPNHARVACGRYFQGLVVLDCREHDGFGDMKASTPKARFIVEPSGRRSAVVIALRDYERLLAAWEEVADARDFADAKASSKATISVEQLRRTVMKRK